MIDPDDVDADLLYEVIVRHVPPETALAFVDRVLRDSQNATDAINLELNSSDGYADERELAMAIVRAVQRGAPRA